MIDKFIYKLMLTFKLKYKMKPKPINNPEYTNLFYLIHSGINTPSLISKNTKYSITNISMKLKELKGLGFIKNKRFRSINKSSTSIYSISYNGISNYMFNIINPKKPAIKNKNQIKKRLSSFISQNKKRNISLFSLIEMFIFDIALIPKEYEKINFLCWDYFAKVKLKINTDLILELSQLDRNKIKNMFDRKL